ncbi:Flavin-dependent halogenase ascD [Cladobotryum mycophilum]|uniref:Flavin-dependent halogenase ascD n=1 Tax=Cladobotryum mycophilum TaxID=491253 RepID=A0ABR0SH70_9HYPO
MASSIPKKTTVLVIGGGPGGSYTAAALAREGIDTVLLEGDKFPRYHIGESMLASMRHLLRFIDLDKTFDQYGFVKKPGAAFKLNKNKREGYTDFIAAGGPNNYSWNVIRSEADMIMFEYAGKSGAKIFDGVQVKSIEFENPTPAPADGGENPLPGRPVKATYMVKDTKATGEISFDYVVDASGRIGILSTKYMKNRRYNQGLKNVANWGYFEGCGAYSPGTHKENSPFFEALQDESGWAWLIPLHNGTTSVGVVMNQQIATEKKKERNYDGTKDFYLDSLTKLAPNLMAIIGEGKLVSEIKSASDYSYSASSYAFPNARIVGDAGCFIDPYFSSGVHLALTGGLSAATTICAAIRGDCDEEAAWKWHSTKVSEAYTRFLLVVLSAYRQIRSQNEPVLSDFDEDNFDRAFAFFRPVIQGTADAANSKLTQSELNQTLEFCANAFEPVKAEDRDVAMEKIAATVDVTAYHADLSPEQRHAVNHIRARQMMRTEDTMHLENFTTDVIDGLVPHLERGALGLKKKEAPANGVESHANGVAGLPPSANGANGDA